MGKCKVIITCGINWFFTLVHWQLIAAVHAHKILLFYPIKYVWYLSIKDVCKNSSMWLKTLCVLMCCRSPWKSTWRTACWSAPCRTCCVTTTTTMMDISACTSSTQLSVSLLSFHVLPFYPSTLSRLSRFRLILPCAPSENKSHRPCYPVKHKA